MNVQLRSTTEMSRLISKRNAKYLLTSFLSRKGTAIFFFFFVSGSFWQALHHVDIGKFQISC